MEKNEKQQLPTFTNVHYDLKTKPEMTTDSWYVRTNCLSKGHQIGFEWHQMVVRPVRGFSMSVTDFLGMDATSDIYLVHSTSGLGGKHNGPAKGACHVESKYGVFEGDEYGIKVDFSTEDCEVHAALTPRMILHNGCSGLLPLLNAFSYQFSFPDALMNGTLRIKDETYPMNNAVAWVDRQYTKSKMKNVPSPNWLWLGMNLDMETGVAMSLWDPANPNDSYKCFATIADRNGVHSMHPATVGYYEMWNSKLTKNLYPAEFRVTVPTADIALWCRTLQSAPEFYKGTAGIYSGGSQALIQVNGHYGKKMIDSVEIVEVLGDFSGKYRKASR